MAGINVEQEWTTWVISNTGTFCGPGFHTQRLAPAQLIGSLSATAHADFVLPEVLSPSEELQQTEGTFQELHLQFLRSSVVATIKGDISE